MTHPLVVQLRFARSEFARCLAGVSEAEGVQRIMPMNSIGWMVGHLANQEQAYWLLLAQGKTIVAGLNDRVGTGKPASTPPLAEMWSAWDSITSAADIWLDALTPLRLTEYFIWNGKPRPESIGTMLLRNIYHYWFHTGEAHAVRQQLGHTGPPDFVGNMSAAMYQPE